MLKTKDIKKIACIGSGVIGSSWASYFLFKGLTVNIQDVSEDRLEKAKKKIKENLEFFVEVGALGKNDPNHLMKRAHFVLDIKDAVQDVQLIQESIIEEYGIKQELLKEIDAVNTEALYCSSTSGLLISEIAKYSKNASRCITAHPFNPPHLVPLVELVKGGNTSPETMDTAFEFYKAIGKEPVKIFQEIPGHVANRLQLALWREAIDLVAKGVCSVEDVDKACQYGPGLRWGIMGINMILHLGGGEEGLKKMVEAPFGPALEVWWADMATWNKFPEGSKKILTDGCEKAMGGRSFGEMAALRDQRLVGLLKVLEKL